MLSRCCASVIFIFALSFKLQNLNFVTNFTWGDEERNVYLFSLFFSKRLRSAPYTEKE